MKEKNENIKIVISGGGTGGHVFPAIAIADALKKKNSNLDILFVGAEKKMEMQKVPDAGYPIVGLPITGLSRKISFSLVTFIINLYRSLIRARFIIKDFKPHIAVGVGGYASYAVLRVACARKIPAVIQEQNSYAGITNKLLAKRVKKVFVAYDHMDKYFPPEKIIKAGNPVRNDLIDLTQKRDEAFEYFGLEKDKKVILSLGGSLGAGTINKSLLKGIDKIQESKLQLIWQTGKYYYEDILNKTDNKELRGIKIMDFIARMDLAYAAADVIISRAGALSISELSIVGKPVILVPSPNVAEDHQTRNAMALADKNAAVLIKDSDAQKDLVDRVIELLNNDNETKKLSNNISNNAITDSADRIAADILNMIA